MADLTERLKELLMGCDYNEVFSFNLAKQLAPEIEKMIPRWIPVGERLPDEGQFVDILIHSNVRVCDLETIVRSNGSMQFENEELTFYACQISHWMPIPKGPME